MCLFQSSQLPNPWNCKKADKNSYVHTMYALTAFKNKTRIWNSTTQHQRGCLRHQILMPVVWTMDGKAQQWDSPKTFAKNVRLQKGIKPTHTYLISLNMPYSVLQQTTINILVVLQCLVKVLFMTGTAYVLAMSLSMVVCVLHATTILNTWILKQPSFCK